MFFFVKKRLFVFFWEEELCFFENKRLLVFLTKKEVVGCSPKLVRVFEKKGVVGFCFEKERWFVFFEKEGLLVLLKERSSDEREKEFFFLRERERFS